MVSTSLKTVKESVTAAEVDLMLGCHVYLLPLSPHLHYGTG